nr:hypothetical protein [Tanacetum cinerariifolium]
MGTSGETSPLLHRGYYHIHISQLSVIGSAKVSHFEVLCRIHGFELTVGLFRCFYVNSKNKGRMSFSKRPGSDAVCYTKPLDSLKHWNYRFFWVDAFACPASFPWNTSKGVPKDPFPKSFEFNAEYFATLVALPDPFHKYPEPFICLVGISHYYTLDEDAYPEFLGDNDEEMDLLSFIRTANPTKVRVTERQRVENKPRLLESTVGCVVSFLPIAPAHASNSSHHFGTNIAKAEVDSIVKSSAPVIVTVSTMIASIDADATTDRAPVAPSLFGDGSSSTGRTDSVRGGFYDVSGSDFLIGGICTVVDPDSDLQKFTFRNGVQPMDLALMTARKRKLKTVVDEQAELLKVRDGDIESLKAQLLLKAAKAAKAIRLGAEVREQEVADLDAQVIAVKLQNDNLVDQVHELEIPSAELQEKVTAYEDFIDQLEKFQDKKMEEVNEKFDKLCADFVEMALHLEEKFYPHILTTISGRRWLLTHGMELTIVKCLNSTEYLSDLEAAISKTVEKGMQEGLSAGITYGAKGRKLANVAAYNTFVEADYLSSLQRLQNVNFSLITKLKSSKDASVDTIMILFRLDDALAERLGLTESQHHANRLMVPIYHSPDQRVVGASALSLYLDVSHSRVKKMRENIARHVSALRGVFVPLSEPLSVAALEGTKGTSGSTHDTTTTLSVTFVSASTIPPISTDDYEVAYADGQGVPVWMTRPQMLRTLAFF